jgi:hypothetical protein
MIIENNSKLLAIRIKELSRQWERVKPFWSDEQSRRFEKELIRPILSNSTEAIASLELLDELITRIRHDCE